MKIIITGVAGFIGANLAERLLRDGHRVIGIDNLTYGLRSNIPEGVDFHQLDIRGREIYPLFAGTDAVFHLAAKNCIADCQADPVETADINVRGTVNVFEAARLGGVRKVIYAESSAIYEGAKTYPTPETDEAPESFYAISKMAGKYFAEAYARFYGSGMRFTALRYFCVYGPVQDYRRTIPPVMSAFIIKLLKGEAPVIYGTGEKRRDFVYVDDINDFHIQCLTDHRTDNRVFNLGAGINYSVNEIYALVSNMLNIPIDPIRRPDLPGEAQVTLADITAARALGWEPRTDIETGLRNAIAYIRSEMEKVYGVTVPCDLERRALMRRAIFLDRDGVINQVIMRNGEPHSPRTREEFVLNEDAVDAVQLFKSRGFLTIVVTNQPDIARGKLRREDLDWMLDQVRQRCRVDDILVCPHDDGDACSCRKPLPGMILNGARKWGIDLGKSFMIGDTWKDREAAHAAGCRFILIDAPYNQAVECDLRVAGLRAAAELTAL